MSLITCGCYELVTAQVSEKAYNIVCFNSLTLYSCLIPHDQMLVCMLCLVRSSHSTVPLKHNVIFSRSSQIAIHMFNTLFSMHFSRTSEHIV